MPSYRGVIAAVLLAAASSGARADLAIGVSGNTPQEDEDIAKAGAAAASVAIATISRK